jgi:transcriptional regulator with XRE-family HTH domain
MRMNLKLWRIKNNLTTKQVAERLGITRQYYSLIERGERNPRTFWLDFQKSYDISDINLKKLEKNT